MHKEYVSADSFVEVLNKRNISENEESQFFVKFRLYTFQDLKDQNMSSIGQDIWFFYWE